MADTIIVDVTGGRGARGLPGSDAEVTTANVLAALAAAPLSDAEKATFAAAIGFPVYADLAAANAALPTGRTFWNSTDNRYETTTA